ISLAKEFEHIFLPHSADPIVLDRSDPALRLLQRIRDEAHRFALSYHRKLRSRPLSFSMLDRIPGVGPKRKRRLIRHFGSLERIREASVDEIASLEGMNRTVAERVKEFLGKLEVRES
ncbi:TPA: excinuclease ABC subunit C, partial [Candidatus Poribacteria bacterium]|nr:excinuclease ABC subunit C [Candidatus Poribacteria bacterium]HEX29409.1 excinuclease ABC subunit C [Candidatus Poribacteria bacterium]